ncbi:tail fiber assembly protein [Escherichia coli]|uniref:tail fiber assembly protein n=1 Tax=Escherichia coli TaxID=562 RepID=UPI002074FA6E|nr:tail fiber assembly protein [Escherichia coli]
MYVWSAKSNGFFPISEKEKFEASGLWPDDGVIVSEEEHKKLFMDIPPGKQIGTLNGKPALIDIPQPTKKELIAIAEVKKSQLREKAGNDSNLLIVFYVQIMPDDLVMQLHRF